jgi:hypothetical protein
MALYSFFIYIQPPNLQGYYLILAPEAIIVAD